MTAYYNEFDGPAAHVLHHQVSNGVIAPGFVDIRSIKEVSPDVVRHFTQCHWFAGGGFWSVAARMAGWSDNRPLWTASCPCQPFSAAGKGGGTDDPRHLWPDLFRLVRAVRPPVLVGEQVAGKAGYGWFDGVRADLEREGYSCRAVDFPACSVDAPHQRNRLYWVAVLGNTQHTGLEGQRETGEAQKRRAIEGRPTAKTDGSGATSVSNLADASRVGWREGRAEHEFRGGGSAVARADAPDGPSNVANADSFQQRGRGHTHCAADLHPNGEGPNDKNTRPNGAEQHGTYWSDSEWIICHDGNARRTQPDIRFLVNGLPGRVDLWRIGGNAIVPQAASEVLKALMDILPEWST